jgi:hypothetical protein
MKLNVTSIGPIQFSTCYQAIYNFFITSNIIRLATFSVSSSMSCTPSVLLDQFHIQSSMQLSFAF